MPVRLFYVDESYDDTRFCLSAVSLRENDWKDCYERIKAFRKNLKDDYGIPLRKEIHAQPFVSGRGKVSSTGIVTKWERSRIFFEILNLVASLPKVWLFNVCIPVSGGIARTQMVAWDRLINRIERTMLEHENREIPTRRTLSSDARTHMSHTKAKQIEEKLLDYKTRALIFADEGREHDITKAIRRMHVFNHIPSQYGAWEDGNLTKNITTAHLVEDPNFKKSERSYLIQLADCVAFALLKKEVPPTPNVRKYGLDKMFESALAGVCYKEASKYDPLGIVKK